MEKLISYETVSEAIVDLNKRGYTSDFLSKAKQGIKYCHHLMIPLLPDEFEINETYRFEGITDPGDEMIVFAISSKKSNMKGIVVNGYGMYADTTAAQMVGLLKKKGMVNQFA